MPPLDALLSSLQLRQYYPFIALLLTLAIQVVRTNDTLRTYLWAWVPSGARWVLPKLAGGAVGFVEAFAAGQTVGAALLAAVGGALGIGLASMGWAAALKESPIPWDGGKGGDPRPTSKLPPLSETFMRDPDRDGPLRFIVRYVLAPLRARAFAGAAVTVVLLAATALTGCASAPPVPKDPSARAEYFAERVREAVDAKEEAKHEVLTKEAAGDTLVRSACSLFVVYRGYAPDLQALADVDALCKGYVATPPPAQLEPAPEPAPAPTISPPAEAAPPDAPDASAPLPTPPGQ